MMIVLAYDINTTTTGGCRRLREMAKLCEANGTRVQDSVFEMLLDPRQLEELKGRIGKLIDSTQDSVRFYRLGKNYLPRIELMGSGASPMTEDTFIA